VMNNVTTGTMSMEYPMAVNGSRYWYSSISNISRAVFLTCRLSRNIDDVTLYRPTNDTIYNTMNILCEANFTFPQAPSAMPLVPIPLVMPLLPNQNGSSLILWIGPVILVMTFAVVLIIWERRRTTRRTRQELSLSPVAII